MAKPKIRFKGYTDDWEQRKLSELLYLSSERNDGSYTRDDVLAASLGTELQKKHIYFGLRATDESVKNYKVVLPNDVIYTKSPIKGFPNGIIRTSKGENGIVPTLYCVYHSVDVINPSIIQAYFESKERLDAYLVPLVNIGARNNVNITDKEFLDGSLCIPKDKAEQDKIVNVLERLSNLITLHQCKCHLLLKLLHNDWEQRKFGDLGSVAMCKRIFKEQTSTDGDIPFYKIGTFGAEPDAFISRELFEEYREKFQYPNIGDMLISASGTIGRTVEYKGEEAYFQDSNIVWFKHDDRVDNSFLKCIYEIVKWSGIEGSTIKRLYNDNFLKTEFSIPKITEQQQIGMYFQCLDHLITLHHRKYTNTLKSS
mgnify:FL=1